MNIPFLDLTRQYRNLEPEINKAVFDVLSAGRFTLGPQVASFEKEFASYIGSSYAVALGSGTDALTLSMRALGLGVKDEVIVPANAYPTAFGLALSGVRIKLIDVGHDGNLNPTLLNKTITKRTRAIVPVHLYGNPCDLLSIHRCIGSKNIHLIEDAAQAHVRKAGSFGAMGIFSFYPTKNLGAYGDGGMVVTNNKHIAQTLLRLRQYGEKRRYHSVAVSGVSRLDELQAAILRVKLKHLDRWNRRRARIASYYRKELNGVGDLRFLDSSFIIHHSSFKPTHHLFVIRTKHRDALQRYLTIRSIVTTIHYPSPIHLQPSFKHLGYKRGDFPVSEALSKEVLSLPIFPELTDAEAETVVKEVKRFFKKLR